MAAAAAKRQRTSYASPAPPTARDVDWILANLPSELRWCVYTALMTPKRLAQITLAKHVRGWQIRRAAACKIIPHTRSPTGWAIVRLVCNLRVRVRGITIIDGQPTSIIVSRASLITRPLQLVGASR